MINTAFLRENWSAFIAEEGDISSQEEDAWYLKYLKVLFMVLNSYSMPDTVLNIQHILSHLILAQPYEVGTINSLILQWQNWGTETLRDFLKVTELPSGRTSPSLPPPIPNPSSSFKSSICLIFFKSSYSLYFLTTRWALATLITMVFKLTSLLPYFSQGDL